MALKLYIKSLSNLSFTVIFLLFGIQTIFRLNVLPFNTLIAVFFLTIMGGLFIWQYSYFISDFQKVAFEKYSKISFNKNIIFITFLSLTLLQISLTFSYKLFVYFGKIHIFQIASVIVPAVTSITGVFTFIFLLSELKTNKLLNNPRNPLPSYSKKDVFIYLALIILFIFSGFYFRLANLALLDPYTDEYLHLLAAKSLLNGDNLENVYQRSLYIVTVPLFYVFKWLGLNLWNARALGAIVNTLAIIPLWFIGKKISKTFSLILIVLYLFNPWVIGISRNVREYAYYPIIFYSTLLFQMNFLLSFKQRKVNFKVILLGVLLIIPLIYSLVFDQSSTLKVIALSYIPFIYLIAINFFHKKLVLRILFPVVFLLFLIFAFYIKVPFLAPRLSFEKYWIEFFFSNSENQWFYNYNSFFGIFILMLSTIVLFFKNIKQELKLLIINFYIYLYFFSFHFDRYLRPRYGFSIQIFYIPLMALGLYVFYLFFKSMFKKVNPGIAFGIVLLLLINVKQSLVPALYSNHGYVPITNEYHDSMSTIYKLVKEYFSSEKVLISTVHQDYIQWIGEISFKEYYRLESGTTNNKDFIFSKIAEHDSGIILTDHRRGVDWEQPIPLENFFVGDTLVTYVGEFDKNYMFVWGK